MLQLLFSYWWIAVPAAGVVAFCAVRFCAERTLDSLAEDILRGTQSNFAAGDVEVHSVTAAGTKIIDGETATLYDIDATITPSGEDTEWLASDLFLRGVDEYGDIDPLRVGEIRKLQRWDGESFVPAQHNATLEGTQRLKLSAQVAGSPGPTRFNYNFACFGAVFDLPPVEGGVLVTA